MRKLFTIMLFIVIVICSCENQKTKTKIEGTDVPTDEITEVVFVEFGIKERSDIVAGIQMDLSSGDKKQLVKLLEKNLSNKQIDLEISNTDKLFSYPRIILKCNNQNAFIDWDFPTNKMIINEKDYYIQSQDSLEKIYELLKNYSSNKKTFM